MWLFHGRGPLPDFESTTLLIAAEPESMYPPTNQWPWLPASQSAYEALSDEGRGWVKCRLADAIEEAGQLFQKNDASAAA